MLKKITSSVLIAAALLLGSFAVVMPVSAATVDPTDQINKGITAAGGDTSKTDELPTLIQNIINVLLFIAGAVAVIMIILGAIRYITSNGDQADVKAAKDTILYSVVGLIVAIMAFAIVNFVVSKL
jgi:heme/copper-type cytochrome/quinol oxidase subunit 2